jgi:hypothetical protein
MGLGMKEETKNEAMNFWGFRGKIIAVAARKFGIHPKYSLPSYFQGI